MPAMTNYIGVLKDSLFEIESTDYANQVNRVRLIPDTPSQQIKTLVPDGALSDTDSPTWTLEVSIVQKYATGGLVRLLNTTDPGTLLDVVWQPVKDVNGQPEATFQIRSQPVAVGGDQGAFGVTEVTFVVEGTPVFADQAS